MRCRWLSHRPGSTRRPRRSMTFVLGPTSADTSASEPTRTKRPSRIATADATGLDRSSVVIAPPRRTRAAASLAIGLLRPAAGQLPEHVGLDVLFHPRDGLVRPRLLDERRQLLAEQDAEQPDEGNDGRRGG